MYRNRIARPLFLLHLLLVLLETAVASPLAKVHGAAANETEEPRERAPEMQKPEPQQPQPPQLTFPLPFFPNAFQPQLPLTFPFLFPSFTPRPSGRGLDLPLLPLDFELSEGDQMRRNPGSDKKKQKKKRPKKPKTPKPIAVYQKDDQVALEGGSVRPGLAGQFANGNQGSYLGYYMVYLVEVSWNGSNQTQTIIAGRPILATKPTPTESAQITELSGSLTADSASKPPSTTQCFFQRSTTTDHISPSEATDKPGQENNEQEIISEEMETAEEYEDESGPKKADKKSKGISPDALPIF